MPPQWLLITAFLVMTTIWGTTWAVVRVGLDYIPPFTGAALRFAIGGALLLLLARWKGIPLGRDRWERRLWWITGIGSFVFGYGTIYWAEQWVPSGLAAVLFALLPIFVAWLGHFWLPNERLTWRTSLGTVAGFLGILVIFSEDLDGLAGPGAAGAAIVLLLSPLAFALTSVSAKRWGAGLHALSLSAIPMLIGAACLGVAAFLLERDIAVTWTASAVGSVLYLALFGSAVSFGLFYWMLGYWPAGRMSLIAYVTPVIAVIVGTLMLDEPLSRRLIAGSTLVLVGVAAASGLGGRSRRTAVQPKPGLPIE